MCHASTEKGVVRVIKWVKICRTGGKAICPRHALRTTYVHRNKVHFGDMKIRNVKLVRI